MIKTKKSRLNTVAGIAWITLLAPQSVFALGTLASETWSFYRTDPNRATNLSSVSLGPQLSFQNPTLEGKLDVRAVGFINDSKSITAESFDAYVASREGRVGNHQLSVGRRFYGWSNLDEAWNMGIWEPRFMWDPLKPKPVGMTGAFYEFKVSYLKIRAFGSPVAIPERGVPMNQCGTQICSASPFFMTLPSTMMVMNRSIPMNYQIQDYSLSQALLRPSGAVSIEYGEREGPWIAGRYGYLPINQVDLAVDASLQSQSNSIQALIQPRFYSHHLISAEGGLRYDNVKFYASATQEIPVQTETSTSSSRIYVPMGPSRILAAGFEVSPHELFRFGGNALTINENAPSMDTSLATVNLPSRFQYKQAWQATVRIGQFPSLIHSLFSYTNDIQFQSSLISADILLNPTWRKARTVNDGLSIGLGSDFLTGNSTQGFFGQYIGNDRVRAKINYVF